MSLDIRWLGHAGFRISFPDSTDATVTRVVYIDTWLANPKLPADMKDTVPTDADLVLVTHGHFDHAGSTPDIVKASKHEHVKVVTNFEICLFFEKKCGLQES